VPRKASSLDAEPRCGRVVSAARCARPLDARQSPRMRHGRQENRPASHRLPPDGVLNSRVPASVPTDRKRPLVKARYPRRRLAWISSSMASRALASLRCRSTISRPRGPTLPQLRTSTICPNRSRSTTRLQNRAAPLSGESTAGQQLGEPGTAPCGVALSPAGHINVSSGPPQVFARAEAYAGCRKVSCRPTFPSPAGDRRTHALEMTGPTMTKIKDRSP
jgi:hypothetical protein